ncbi:class I SAM-dependent methyltransferase [Nocardia brasiliensis]|uniref:class I SAM-dependent methyltransferase n=1 Tax=Nocardia brasiliensis TaxID=37326 RepID=UPI0024556DC6|nr:class I SAM-dependent methyltransferase [Nocardia brasiliensis]
MTEPTRLSPGDDQFAALGSAYAASEQWPMRRQLEAPSLLTAIGDLSGLSIVDAGCGSGFYVRLFARLGAARVIGIDPSPGMLAVATGREDAQPLGVRYVHSDLADAGRVGPVDLVTAVYVLPYAETIDDLRGMCRGAADALHPGGRFVAFALNPEFSADPTWYQRYGFVLRSKTERAEGEPLTLTSHQFDPPLSVTGYHWSREAHETAMRDAGFDDIAWTAPVPTPEGVSEHGADFWEPYLRCPHALILTARIPGRPADR